MCGWMWASDASGGRRSARGEVARDSVARETVSPAASMPPVEPSHVRVSDSEREQVATRLREAAGRGELSLDEAGERQAAAYAAVTRGDLAPLTSDLPAPPAPPPDTSALAPVRDFLAGVHPVMLIAAVVALAVTAGVVVIDMTGGHADFPWFVLWIPIVVGLRGHRHRHHRHRPDRDEYRRARSGDERHDRDRGTLVP